MTETKRRKRYEMYHTMPHFELVCEKGRVNIPSIFMFEDGAKELFPFLAACKAFECSVYFENEDIYYDPKEDDPIKNLELSLYMTLKESKKFEADYRKYLNNADKMKWENAKPILKEDE